MIESMGAGIAEMGAAGVAVPPEAKRRRVLAANPTTAAAAAGGKGPRRARRRVQAQAGHLQRLFQACRAVFRGPGTVPAPAEVALLRAILGKLTLSPSLSPLLLLLLQLTWFALI